MKETLRISKGIRKGNGLGGNVPRVGASETVFRGVGVLLVRFCPPPLRTARGGCISPSPSGGGAKHHFR